MNQKDTNPENKEETSDDIFEEYSLSEEHDEKIISEAVDEPKGRANKEGEEVPEEGAPGNQTDRSKGESPYREEKARKVEKRKNGEKIFCHNESDITIFRC